jgi:polysaccharide chain length determinant protein (PEP-CTERM system associated)
VLPGKTYTPDDVARIAWRYKWAILVPLVIASIGTMLVSRRLPDLYRSETVILVVPQQVPESYVRSTVTTRIEDRLQSISQQILSRTRLERIIQDFNLYTRERESGIMEDIVERMRNRDINVEVLKGDAFRVTYVGEDPTVVMRVTDRLASLFIEENLKDRELLAEGTNQFLTAQLEDARRRLIEQEKKLEDYRQRFSGELPTQAETNLQAVQNAQMQIQALVESINRDRDRRLLVERSIADLTVDEHASTASGSAEPAADAPASRQLAYYEKLLADMELRLKPEHPDLIRMRRTVAGLRQRAESEALARPLSADPNAVLTPLQAQRRARLKELQQELEGLDRQIAAKRAEEDRQRRQVATYQGRLEAMPARETELIELTRDYSTLQQMYASLLAKNEESKIAANLERRQIGEQFKVLDPARRSERPFSPNRPRINLMGALAGLTLGMGLAAFFAYRDTSFRSTQDVTSVLSLPVLAQIPLLRTPAEHYRARRRRVAVSLAALVLFAGFGTVAWFTGALTQLVP